MKTPEQNNYFPDIDNTTCVSFPNTNDNECLDLQSAIILYISSECVVVV